MALPTIPQNTLTSTGLTLVSQAVWLNYFTLLFQTLYGSNVILTQDSPDGQLINIIIQVLLDNQDLTQQVFSSFDPMQAFGTTLDQRLGIAGIVRLSGTYSQVNITIQATQSTIIYGLDQTVNPVYTLSDSSGNQWELVTTTTLSAGSNINIIFEASSPGPINDVPGSIINQVTSVVGISAVSNPQGPFIIGTSEETDSAVKIRFQSSQQGYYTQLYTALSNVSGISSINIEENDTGQNVSTIPNTGTATITNANSIWVIVGGNPVSSEIANAIYQNRSAGCSMVGSQFFPVARPNGSTFTVYWDVVALVDLYVQLHLQSINGTTPPLVANVQNLLSTSASYSTTATWANATTSMTINGSTTGLAVGQLIQGTGISDNTFTTAISGSTVTFSPEAIASGSTASVHVFYPWNIPTGNR